jgi:hypothetical protein
MIEEEILGLEEEEGEGEDPMYCIEFDPEC